MSNSPISQALKVKLARTGRWMMACLGTCMLAASIGHAQLATPTTTPTVTTEMKSGLFLYNEKDIPSLTLSEVGKPTALSSARIEFRDPAGRVVAAINGSVGPGKPLLLQHRFTPGTGLQQLSAVVRITSFKDAGNAVMTVFEHIGPDSILARNIVCGPGTTGGGGNAMCLGWYIGSSAASPQ